MESATLEKLGNRYEKQKEEALLREKTLTSRIDNALKTLRDKVNRELRELGENSQVDDAIAISMLSNILGDVGKLILEISVQKNQYLKDDNMKMVKMLDNKLNDIKMHKEQIEKYNEFNRIKIRKMAVEKELEKENLPKSEEKSLNKELFVMTKELADIATFFGKKDEKELAENMDEREKAMLSLAEGEENIIESMRGGTGSFAHIKDLSSTIASGGLSLDMIEKIGGAVKDKITDLINEDAEKTVGQDTTNNKIEQN